jgi:glutamate-5-semialdehyde dehydrogenase
MDVKEQILDLGKRARVASKALARASSEQKNEALLAMAGELVARTDALLAANEKDVARAKTDGLSGAMIDRLTLTPKRVQAMADGVRQVAELPDPVGEVMKDWTRPNGIHISKVRVPIGVVGIVYESRPNVTSDAAVLCTKTGNATILRGGSESILSNVAIAEALQAGLAKAHLPADSILLVPTTDREAVKIMAQMDQYLDMIVPRGGPALIEAVVSHARMPVIKHYHGLCIIYVDKEADPDMAAEIVFDAKCQRPGVCNAVETVLVHRDAAPEFLKKLIPKISAKRVEIRADDYVFENMSSLNYAPLRRAVAEDWHSEFLDYVLAMRAVDSIGDAIHHIEANGSHHSDAIVTSDTAAAEKFLNEVDSATVYWNASTRFTDGGEFGFGAEIGISTDKLHARGPMALEELTTYKYTIRGNGQVRG